MGSSLFLFGIKVLEKIKSEIIFKKACQIEKDAYFCTRFENEGDNKKRINVHRHIELTAVPIYRDNKRE